MLRLSISLLLVMSLAPLSTGAPLIPDLINGFGAASTFQIFGQGQNLEGGFYDWTDVCGHCEIRVTLGEGTFVTNGETFVQQLPPGVYELREFKGLYQFTQNRPHDYSVEFHGAGKIAKLD